MTEEPSGTTTHFLEDGSVQVCYRDYCGWVTSAHLIIPKALQLKIAYLNANKKGTTRFLIVQAVANETQEYSTRTTRKTAKTSSAGVNATSALIASTLSSQVRSL